MTNNADMPARPTPYMDMVNMSGELYCDNTGLTKRETFAAMAMQAMISSRYYSDFCGKYDDKEVGIAISAIDHADALLAQLEQSK
tara:strand:- start:8347 stop:8601 length:255 start_codon:yes stop_codon:yes gene_type:complete